MLLRFCHREKSSYLSSQTNDSDDDKPFWELVLTSFKQERPDTACTWQDAKAVVQGMVAGRQSHCLPDDSSGEHHAELDTAIDSWTRINLRRELCA